MNIDSVMIWFYHIGYKIENTLEYIFGDDGRRYEGDVGGL